MGEFDPSEVAETVDRLYDRACRLNKRGVFPVAIHTQIISAALAHEHLNGKAATDKQRNTKLRRVLNQLAAEGRLIVYYETAAVFHPKVSEGENQGGGLRQTKCFRPPSLLVKLAWAAKEE
jgi:hypothetical protein